ncbi:MAG TPA: hypothetical protein VFA20_22530 [Myxococcaceae bacterium]|nr:hypothetical protein [Myxococcaceae bacterium]
MNRTVKIAVALLAMAGSLPVLAGRFGTACQEDYQNTWQNTLPYSWNRCSGFNSELGQTDTQIFYWNLQGGKYWWEGDGDQYGLETVNIVFANTHGGAWGNNSVWAMWDQNQLAYSGNMRLGNESWGTMIFSTYSCETLKYDDGLMWTRMGPIMKGGLYIATGSHDLVWAGWTTDDVGADYADDLQHGVTIKESWHDGASDWYEDNSLAVMTTGTDSNNCWNRQNGMTWQNIAGYTRLRDSAIGWYCYSAWNT